MSEWVRNLDTYNDWEPPDPPVDINTTLRCVNPQCFMYSPENDPGAATGETWHPEITSEYQGEYPHGARVDVYIDEAFACPECGKEGREE